MKLRLLPLLLFLALAPGAFAHSGEWGTVPPPVTYPPDPLPKWPGAQTMVPKDTPTEAPRAPGRRTPRGATRSGWSRWWDLHRDRVFPAARGAPPSAEERDDILAALRAATKDPSEEVRTSALVALGRARDAKSIPMLIAALRDETSSATVVRSSLIALGLIGDDAEETREVGRGFLASNRWSTEIRACAALAIGLAGDVDGRQALTGLLVDRKTVPGLRAAAAAGLGILGDARDASILAKTLTGGTETDPGVRAWAAAALANARSGVGRTALMAALSDLDLGVARQAALSLGRSFDPWARKAVTKTLTTDGDAVTRAYAALALADILGTATALEPLRAAARSGDEILVPHAVMALAIKSRGFKNRKTSLETRDLISSQLTELTPVDHAGALVTAAMFVNAQDLRKRIGGLAIGKGDPEMRGHAAFAAAVLGRSGKPVAPLIAAETPLPLLREVGRAATLHGDPTTEERLRDLLASDTRESSRCVAAVNLGRSRREGREASNALLAVLGDKTQPELIRGCAAVGLGRRLESARPSPLSLSVLRLSPELVGGPIREVISMR